MILDTEERGLPQISVAVHVSVTSPPQTEVDEKVEALEFPLIKQSPDKPLEKGRVLAAGISPQSTVISESGVIVGNAAGLTVMVLETGASVLPHTSVAVQVSVTVPPQAPGVDVKVEGLEVPLIKQAPLKPLE